MNVHCIRTKFEMLRTKDCFNLSARHSIVERAWSCRQEHEQGNSDRKILITKVQTNQYNHIISLYRY